MSLPVFDHMMQVFAFVCHDSMCGCNEQAGKSGTVKKQPVQLRSVLQGRYQRRHADSSQT